MYYSRLSTRVLPTNLQVSAYHRAGPINLQPRWLRPSKLLRLHVGRGGAFRRCPVSMQLDLPLPGADPDATWVARARTSYRTDGGGFGVNRPELTLKRRWRW